MNFDYNEEQQLLADSVRRFLAKDYGFEARKKIVASAQGYSPQVWATFAQMGLTGLPFPAEFGGFGGGAIDLVNVMEAFGEALVVEPYLPTLMAGRAIARSPLAKSVLPAVIEGRMKLAFAHIEKGARYDLSKISTTARKSGDAWLLQGEKSAVLGAPMADKLVVSARTQNGIELFLVEKERVKALTTLDEMRAAELTLKATKAEPLGGDLELVEEITDFASALACAEAVGAMKFACDTTLEYLKTRKQFGVPIGTFQALQHRMVDMFIAQEQARSMACLACSKVDQSENAKQRARAVSAAKIKIADNARHVSQESVQLHGGMGMSEELKVSHTFRRLTVIAGQFGDADHHLARFAAL
ncbi:MAG: pimeloyl-CoA dehydrogenase small subunit [Betaproteobacteria bacterium]|nr:MAG: pimeloyl-CoA dehydrogenase small subunit [Betaproteobacteria bacterium]